VLFIGNSFTFGAFSPVMTWRAASVHDLNGEGIGGVPALFQRFADEAGLAYEVSLETSPGKDLQWHIDNRTPRIDRAWDHVLLQSYSTLDARAPGDPAGLVRSATALAATLHARNPRVDIVLVSTWSRADLTYQPGGHWFGRPISAMAADIRAGYDLALRASPHIRAVAPVGQAWTLAIESGLALANPYAPAPEGQINLWAVDNYHASTAGYYLEALVVFGKVSGRDPLALGPDEAAARELGLSPAQAVGLQRAAHDALAAR
jgi:hypothetical protein